MTLTALPPSQRLVDLVGSLGGSWHGYTAMCRCPAHADGTPSLSLRQGDHQILVTCFAGCMRHDVLRALRLVRPGKHYDLPAGQIAARAVNVERLWALAVPVTGTLAERYLQARRLQLAPHGVRFLARCPYGPTAHTVFEPALLVAVHDARRLAALQRIFLDCSARYTRKVMLGQPGAGAWRGAGISARLAIAEGFETALAYTQLRGIPCWAALGARRLDLLRLPDHVTELVLAEDRDAEGQRAANRAETRYARPGLRVERAPPPAPFKDWAEALESHG